MTAQNQNIKLLPLSGAYDDSPYCYLLQIDDCSLLLDCGWDDRFDLDYIDRIMEHASKIDAVLISHSDRAHLGALPLLIKRGLKCPIYATVPVYKLGKLVMYDWMNSRYNLEEFQVFNLDDIDKAWKVISSVNYNQKVHLAGHKVIVKPFCAGHSMGGAVWRVTKTGEEAIVYAVAFNHRKERHLNAIPFKEFHRAHVFIMDAGNAQYHPPRRKQRDELLIKRLVDTLRNGGDVMVVTDTAGRVLETAHFLDQMWSTPRMDYLANYPLAMMSNVAASVIEHAKMHIDWMNDKVSALFEQTSRNPFSFRHVHLVHTMTDLDRLRSPKVIMCSQVDMESGYAHEIFPGFVGDPRNTIILTGRSRKDTLGANLIQMAEDAQNGKPWDRFMLFDVRRRVPLDGQELEDYRIRNRLLLELENEKRLEKFRRDQRAHEGSSSEESEDDEEVAKAVDKYIRDAEGKRIRKKGAADITPVAVPVAVPGVSAKLLTENVFGNGTDKIREEQLEVPEKSADEGYEGDGDDHGSDTENLAPGRSLMVEDNALKPQVDNVFDIFFKHHVLHKYGIDQKDKTKKKKKIAQFAMFPPEEERRKLHKTDYGERINADAYMERQRNDMFVPAPMQRPEEDISPEEEAERRRKKKEKRYNHEGEEIFSEDEDGNVENAEQPDNDEDWPTKCVSDRELLEMKCNLEFIEFEGKADGESLKHILEGIKPRSLILVKGLEEDYQHLIKYCKDNQVVESEVMCPKLGETVSLGLNMEFLDTELTDDLCEQVKFTPLLEGGKMAWVDAVMVKRKSILHKYPPELQERFVQEFKEDDLIADLCPRDMAPPHDSVYMNDVKLTTIRDELCPPGNAGRTPGRDDDRHTAELRQGRLVIDRAFAMRRMERGKFQLEGTLNTRYFKMREFCVSKFAMA